MSGIGIDINPKAYIRELNNGEKQMVEIIRAVSQSSRMVIMDEPTSSLSGYEVDALFAVMKKADKGKCSYYLYITQAERNFGNG